MAAPTPQALGTATNAIAYTGNGYTYSASVTPPTIVAGDIMVCYGYGNKSDAICAISTPSWDSGSHSAWVEFIRDGAVEGSSLAWWSRAANSTADNLTINGGDLATASASRFIIHTFRSCVASGSPLGIGAAAPATTNRTASTSCPFPTVTTPSNDCAIVHFGSRHNDSAAAAWSAQANANLSSIVEQYDAGIPTGGISITTAVMATAGATGTTTSTVTSSDGRAHTFVLLPVAAGAMGGTSALVFTPSATLVNKNLMAGASTITFAQTADLRDRNLMAGASTITFELSAVLEPSPYARHASASITFTASARALQAGEMIGAAALTFSASAEARLPRGDEFRWRWNKFEAKRQTLLNAIYAKTKLLAEKSNNVMNPSFENEQFGWCSILVGRLKPIPLL